MIFVGSLNTSGFFRSSQELTESGILLFTQGRYQSSENGRMSIAYTEALRLLRRGQLERDKIREPHVMDKQGKDQFSKVICFSSKMCLSKNTAKYDVHQGTIKIDETANVPGQRAWDELLDFRALVSTPCA